MANKQYDESFNTFGNSHGVLLSFKSEDTGKTFTNHLSTTLNQDGFRTFEDGDDESKFPKEKKTLIQSCLKQYKNQRCVSLFACMILPVFYHVDPSNLRKHKGSFGEALARHEKKFKCERHGSNEKEWEDKLKKWKDALSQAADLARMVLDNKHESTFIKKIVNVINTRLSSPALYIASCSIGIHQKLPNGLITLQKQLRKCLLKNQKVKISSFDEGIIKIKNALCHRKVLLVLDDVDEPDLVEAIFDMKDWFGHGSKIIVTTRHKSLLRPQLGHEVHKLFNWHAFGENNPISEDYNYKEYSEEVIEWCRGLPLALQVISSSLAEKSNNVWRSAIEKLRQISTNKIVDKLRLSDELLEDDHDQNLFLHLSCFFVKMEKESVVRILDNCDFYTLVGLQNLIDRSLVTIGEYVNDIRMHRLVRDMGRDIVRREAPMDPGKRSRLWHHTHSYNVLRGKTFVQYLEILDLGHSYELITTPDFSGLPNLERLILEHCTKLINVHDTIGCLQKLILLNLKDCQKLKSLPDSICELKCHEKLDISGCSNIECLPTEMDKLTSLKELYADEISMNRVAISADNFGVQPWYSSLWSWDRKQRVSSKLHEIHFPRSLHVLNIAKCNLSLDAFNNLNLDGNPISNLPDSIKNLTRLKTLDIAYCTKIKCLEWLPSNISQLNADGCISLEKVASCAKGYPVEGYMNCNKLVEVEGVFKLEPLENADAQVLASMGILNLEPIKSTIMVSLVFGRLNNAAKVGKEYPSFVQDDIASLFSLSPKKFPPQILYHRGVSSTFLPGDSIPNWFSYKCKDAAEEYCTLPNNVDRQGVINGLSICFVYRCPDAYTNLGLYDGPAIWLRNETKDLEWALYPAWFGLPEDDESGMMWLSYWKVMGSPRFAEFKEFGVKILYQTQNSDPNMGSKGSNNPFENILGNYFSDEERTYYICT
ncbi:unnamed protein product [Withania somnifera]